MRAPDSRAGWRVVRPAASAATTAATATAVQRRADQPAGGSDRALSRQSARPGSRSLDLSARSGGGGALVAVQQERDRTGARRRHAAAELGPQREVAMRGAAGAGDDEREDRMDPAARRCLPGAAG